MTKEDEAEVQRLLNNVDVTELMDMLKKHGNRYSRRILKFFVILNEVSFFFAIFAERDRNFIFINYSG